VTVSNPAPGSLLGPEALDRWLRQGGVALFPTDTLPALAARPEHAGQIWTLKQRPADKPLILMGASLAQLQSTLTAAGASPWRTPWLHQAERCWPGAVTLVLPIPGPITEALHPGGASLGLRVPACPQAQALLARTGPLATTSANPSGAPPARDALEAAALFPMLPRLGPLPWATGSGSASTVLAWRQGVEADQGDWQVLRAGPSPLQP